MTYETSLGAVRAQANFGLTPLELLASSPSWGGGEGTACGSEGFYEQKLTFSNTDNNTGVAVRDATLDSELLFVHQTCK